jgi:hypothetical protein
MRLVCCDDAFNTTCIYVCWKISLVVVSDLAAQKQQGETHADTLTSPNQNVIPSPNKRTHFRYTIVYLPQKLIMRVDDYEIRIDNNVKYWSICNAR